MRSLINDTKIKNSTKNVNNSSIQQVQSFTVNNGLDTYAVVCCTGCNKRIHA